MQNQRFPTIFESHLIELVYLLAAGNELEYGLNLKEILILLTTPIRRKGGLNALQCLEMEGERFMEELRTASGLIYE